MGFECFGYVGGSPLIASNQSLEWGAVSARNIGIDAQNALKARATSIWCLDNGVLFNAADRAPARLCGQNEILSSGFARYDA